jgi:HEAT repeat protein
MSRIVTGARFALMPGLHGGVSPSWMQQPMSSSICFATNGDEFSGSGKPAAPSVTNGPTSITARVNTGMSKQSKLLRDALELEERLGDRDEYVRAEAARVLGEITPQLPVTDRLARALKIEERLGDSNNLVRQYACQALGEIIPQLPVEDCLSLSPRIEERLGDSNEDVRWRAGVDLLRITLQLPEKDRLSLALRIEERLGDPDWGVHAEAVGVLGEITPQLPVTDRLARALKIEERLGDSDRFVRGSAVKALGKITPHLPEQDRLARALKIEKRLGWDCHWDVRGVAVETLGEITPHLPGKDRLPLVLKIEEHLGAMEWYVRWVAVETLGEIIPHLDPKDCLTRALAVFECLEDHDTKVRTAAVKALKEIIPRLNPGDFMSIAHRIRVRLLHEDFEKRVAALDLMNAVMPHAHVKARMKFAQAVVAALDLDFRTYLYRDCSKDICPSNHEDYPREIIENIISHLAPRERLTLALEVEELLKRDGKTLGSGNLKSHEYRRRVAPMRDLADTLIFMASQLEGSDLQTLASKLEQRLTSGLRHVGENARKVLGAIKALPSFLKREAMYIRSVCRALYRPHHDDHGKGFLNRGNWLGNRPESRGFDFRDVREVRPGELVSGQFDVNASARTGKIMEKRFQQTQSKPVMIVVDPSAFNAEPHGRRDPVGLVVGKNETYIKPSHSSSQLYKILKAMIAYERTAQNDVSSILDQKTVRANVPRGSEIVVISKFRYGHYYEGLQKIFSRFRRRGVSIRPIATTKYLVMGAAPIPQVGGMRLNAHRDVLKTLVEQNIYSYVQETETFLKRSDGRIVDLTEAQRLEDVPEMTIAELAHKSAHELRIPRAAYFMGGEKYSYVHGKEAKITRMPDLRSPDALDYARLIGFEQLYRHIDADLASVFGFWSSELSNDERARLDELNDMLDQVELPLTEIASIDREEMGDITYPLEQWAGHKLPLGQALAVGPGREFYTKFLELEAHFAKRKAKIEKKRRRWSWLKKILGGKRKIDTQDAEADFNLSMPKTQSPSNSGVDKEHQEGADQVWQKIRPRPRGRNQYLRNFIGVGFDSATATYRGSGEFALSRFDEIGGEKARGKLKGIPSDSSSLPHLVGATIEKVESKKRGKAVVHYRVATDVPKGVRDLQNMNLAAFRAAAANIYGAELYARLTRTIVLEELPESVRDEWIALVSNLQNVSVGEAMWIIQGYVTSHPTIRYHEYVGDPLKESIFKEFKERAERGEARGADEHLSTAIMLGGGVCVEMAKIGKTLMRMAGIPTVFASGFLAQRGNVTTEGHAWPEAVFPRAGGEWHGEPVEMSQMHLLSALRDAAREAYERFMKRAEEVEEEMLPEAAEEDEVQAEEVIDEPQHNEPIAAVTRQESGAAGRSEEVRQWWHALEGADPEQGRRITNWVRALPSLMQLAEKAIKGESVADLMLRNWKRYATTDRSDVNMHELLTRWEQILWHIARSR